MMYRGCLIRSAVFVLLILSPLSVFAQHGEAFDVSKCFSNILVDKKVDLSRTQLRYALLSSWSLDMYQNAQANGSITSLLPKLPVGASFAASDEERIKELQSVNESLAYDQATASSVTWLDQQAGPIIKACLDAQIRNGFGLTSAVFVDNEYDVTLILYWNWAPGGTPVLVKTKHIANAAVTDDNGKHPAMLMEPHAFWSDWGKLGYSTSIALHRTKVDQDIVLNIETDPDIGAQHIVIPKVPPKQNCIAAQEKQDKFGTPYSYTESKQAESLPVYKDDGNGHKYVYYNVDISTLQGGKDGIIDSVSCRKSSPTLYAEMLGPVSPRPSGSVASCNGWYQNNGSTFEITVTWHKTGYVCTPIPWTQEPPSKGGQ
jgi:hypothetical protein